MKSAMNRAMNSAVVVGDVMNDVVVRALGPTEDGSDTESEIRRSPGGSGANQAAWLASLGVPVRFYARVGAQDASEHSAALRAVGVDARLAVDHELPTGSIVVLVAGDGERNMFTDRGANRRLGSDDLPPSLEGVAHLHISGYSLFDPSVRPAVAELMAEALKRSIPVSTDPSSESYLRAMGPGSFLSLTSGATVIFPNGPEALLLSGCREESEAARALSDHYPIVLVKLGRRGALLATRDGSPLHLPAPMSTVVDSTGAGDAFCAGYLAAALDGSAPEDAARAGLAVAAGAVARMGGRPVGGVGHESRSG